MNKEKIWVYKNALGKFDGDGKWVNIGRKMTDSQIIQYRINEIVGEIKNHEDTISLMRKLWTDKKGDGGTLKEISENTKQIIASLQNELATL